MRRIRARGGLLLACRRSGASPPLVLVLVHRALRNGRIAVLQRQQHIAMTTALELFAGEVGVEVVHEAREPLGVGDAEEQVEPRHATSSADSSGRRTMRRSNASAKGRNGRHRVRRTRAGRINP